MREETTNHLRPYPSGSPPIYAYPNPRHPVVFQQHQKNDIEGFASDMYMLLGVMILLVILWIIIMRVNS